MALDLFKISPQQQPVVYLPTGGKEQKKPSENLSLAACISPKLTRQE